MYSISIEKMLCALCKKDDATTAEIPLRYHAMCCIFATSAEFPLSTVTKPAEVPPLRGLIIATTAEISLYALLNFVISPFQIFFPQETNQLAFRENPDFEWIMVLLDDFPGLFTIRK